MHAAAQGRLQRAAVATRGGCNAPRRLQQAVFQITSSTLVGIGLPRDAKFGTMTGELMNAFIANKERMLFVCWPHRPSQTLHIAAESSHDAAEIVAMVGSALPTARPSDPAAAAAPPPRSPGEADEWQREARLALACCIDQGRNARSGRSCEDYSTVIMIIEADWACVSTRAH